MTSSKKKKISIFAVVLLVITTLFFVHVKTELLSHVNCEEDHCPICEIMYTAKKCTSNVSLGNAAIIAFLFAVSYLYFKCSIDENYYVKNISLIENKVRIDC